MMPHLCPLGTRVRMNCSETGHSNQKWSRLRASARSLPTSLRFFIWFLRACSSCILWSDVVYFGGSRGCLVTPCLFLHACIGCGMSVYRMLKRVASCGWSRISEAVDTSARFISEIQPDSRWVQLSLVASWTYLLWRRVRVVSSCRHTVRSVPIVGIKGWSCVWVHLSTTAGLNLFKKLCPRYGRLGADWIVHRTTYTYFSYW
jgi:hypothetical protein